jgi:hypothetical protein
MLPLKFLGDGSYEVTLYIDDTVGGTKPNELREEKREVTAASTVGVVLSSGGGVAAVFRPK